MLLRVPENAALSASYTPIHPLMFSINSPLKILKFLYSPISCVILIVYIPKELVFVANIILLFHFPLCTAPRGAIDEPSGLCSTRVFFV